MNRLLLLLIVPLLLMLFASPAEAKPKEGQVCPSFSTGHIDPGPVASTTFTAPEGWHIVAYCVKAGSAKQGNGPVVVYLDTPVSSITITHPSGKDISHFSILKEMIPSPTPQPTPTPEPTPEPTATPDPTPIPTPSPTATPEPSPRPTPTPTSTPEPTPEPTPSATPSPQPTPPGTPSPEPTPEPSPTSEPTPPSPTPEPGETPEPECEMPTCLPATGGTLDLAYVGMLVLAAGLALSLAARKLSDR